MKYLIVTYGCQMNVHESEKIAGILENMGYACASKREEADIIVFNTCAIIQPLAAEIKTLFCANSEKKFMDLSLLLSPQCKS